MERKTVYLFAAASALTLLFLYGLAFTNNFTGDSGDSVAHYLFARYAYKHLSFLLWHWAKPLFVLIASPFAQFGFIGIKLFNCTLAVTTCFVTFLVAKELKLTYSYLVLPFMFFCPLYFMLAFSGLTEYLFAFIMITAIYLAIKRKLAVAVLLVSFLPFIRSEGLFIAGVFGVYLVFIKQYRLIPLLLTGHIVYSLAGLFYYHNPLWVFTKLPYATASSGYGHGKPFDFVFILLYVIEKPMFLLLLSGIVALLFSFIKVRDKVHSKEETILIYGSFFVFFAAHSAFWWLGIFNSGGFLVPRVLIPLIPLVAIIGLKGLVFLTGLIQKPIYINIMVALVTVLIICFPFTPRSKGIVYNKELFNLPDETLMDNEATPFLVKKIPGYMDYKIYSDYPYLSIPLHVDPFDSLHYSILTHSMLGKIPAKSIIVWDNWYAPTEGGVPFTAITADKSLTQLGTFSVYDNAREIQFTIFQKE